MNGRLFSTVLGVCGATILIAQFDVDAGVRAQRVADVAPRGTADLGGQPDVWVNEISGLSNWGPTDGFRAYSVGTTSCNSGDIPAAWSATTNQHPVIVQSMFRLAPGPKGHLRMEQIGQGWVKHGFCAFDFGECGTCQPTNCGSLGVGCSDPYTAARNGSQGPAGPKYEIDATTGYFPYPSASGTGIADNISRRLRVDVDDIGSGTTADHRFFIEAMYLHPEDSPEDAATANNNASYREVHLTSTGFASEYVGDTVPQLPGPTAWSDLDGSVTTRVRTIDGEGVLYLLYNVYDNGDDTWDYEYLLSNQNYDPSIGSFSVAVPDDVTLTDVGFHDVHYYDGDGDGNQNFSGDDWTWEHAGGFLTWTTEDFATNPSANAIRWGTAYNFRFTANTAPQADAATVIGAFKNTSAFTDVVVNGPSAADSCPADLNRNGLVDSADLLAVMSQWGDCPAGPCTGDLDGDSAVGFSDILFVFGAWGACP